MKTTTRITTTLLAAAVIAISATAADPPPVRPTAASEAYALRMDGRSERAAALLARTLDETPADESAWFELARTRMYHFEFDDAEAAIAKAIELDPQNARYHHFAGVTAVTNAVSKAHSAETRDQVGPKQEKAIAAFERAVALDPGFHDARIELINMLLKTPRADGGSRGKAKKHVARLETADPVYGVAARCMLLSEKKRDKAVDLWKPVVAQHETRADAHAGLAKAALHAGDLDLATTHVDAALRLEPSRQTILLTLCRQCVSEGDNARARRAVDRYLASPPPAPLRAYGTFCLAMLERMDGNTERAEALMAEAKQIDPRVWTTYMEPSKVLFDAP